MLDISSKMSGIALKNSSAMVPYVSKASISTSNPVEKSVPEVPAVPKKPVTAYIRYTNEVRPDVMKKNPNMKVSEVAKLMGQMWKEVPTAKKEVCM